MTGGVSRLLVAVLALAAIAVLLSCGPPADDVVKARLGAYFEAVQSEDTARLAELLLSCPEGVAPGEAPEVCATLIDERAAAVAGQREQGEYRFDHPWGFGLVRAFVLGRGGYWTVDTLDVKGDAAVLRLVLRTQYRPEETQGLPYGAVIEYLGRPLGHVDKVPRGGGGPGTLRWQLDVVHVEARLRRVASRADDEDWRVESLTALPDTATFSQVTWRPR